MEAGFRREFVTAGGDVYVYDYDLLNFERVMNAQSVFNHAQEQIMNPPKRFVDLKMSGGMDWPARAFSHLLMKRLSDGSYEKYDISKTDKVEQVIKELPPRYFKTLMTECKDDFFDKADMLDAGSLKQFKAAFAMISELLSLDPEVMARLHGKNSSQNSSESTTSTVPTNHDDDSENLETAPSIG